jgi:hypothetical protein
LLRALRAEGTNIAGWLRERQLWALLAGALLLWVLAYQVRYAPTLAIGGDVATRERRFDEPYLRGFNASEPANIPASQSPTGEAIAWWQLASQPGQFAYRWATSDARIVLPGLGGGPWRFALHATSGRPDGASIPVVLQAGAWQHELTLQAAPRRYTLVVPQAQGGDFELRLTSPRLTGSADAAERDLGFVVTGVTVAPLGAVRVPAWRVLVALALGLVLAYGVARRSGVASSQISGALGALALLVAALLAWARLPLTVFAPTLPWLLLACYALVVVGARMRQALLLQASSALPLLVVLAFALRLGGMLHPHVIFSDLGLNTNNLRGVVRGDVYFSEALPGEAGGGQAPYPPGQYVVLAPLLLLAGTNSFGHDLAIQIGNALLDSILVGLLYGALRRGTLGERAALCGAALYLLPPPLLRSFSVGEFANIFGQGVAVVVLLGWLGIRVQGAGLGRRRSSAKSAMAAKAAPLALGLASSLAVRPLVTSIGWVASGGVLIALPLLSHLGASISLACLLAALLVLWAMSGVEGRIAATRLVVAGVLAVLGAGLLFYSYPLFVAQLGERTGGTAAGDWGAALGRVGARAVRELRPGGVLFPPLVLLGLLGLTLRGGPQPGTSSLIAAWWLGTLLSLGLLLGAQQAVRYELFLYPGLCLSAGPALAALWRRGRVGALVALLLLLGALWYGGALWYTQLRMYLHG